MKHKQALHTQPVKAPEQKRCYRVERRFCEGRGAQDMLESLLRAHSVT